MNLPACPPIYLGDNHVFISECYDKGQWFCGSRDFTPQIVLKSRLAFWMTPIEVDGYLWRFLEGSKER